MKRYRILIISLLVLVLVGCSPKITFNKKDINSNQAKQITDMTIELLNTHFKKSTIKLISGDVKRDRYDKYLISLKVDIENEDLKEISRNKSVWVLLREVDLENGTFYYDKNNYFIESSVELEKLRKSNYWMVDTEELISEQLSEVEDLAKKENYWEAINKIEKILKISPSNTKSIQLKAELESEQIIKEAKDKLRSTKDTSVYEKQIKRVEEVLEVIPDYPNAKKFILDSGINLTQIYYEQKQFENAILTANNILKDYPSNNKLKDFISNSQKSLELLINSTDIIEYSEGQVKISSDISFINGTILTVKLSQMYDNEEFDAVEEYLIVKEGRMEGIIKIPAGWGATELKTTIFVEAGNEKVEQSKEFYNLYGVKLENIIEVRSSKNNSKPTIMHNVHYYRELKEGHYCYEIQNDYHSYPDYESVKDANKIRLKNSCKVYSYAVLQKDSDKMKDKPIKISGRIFDTWEEGRYTYILLATSSNLDNVAIIVDEHIPYYKGDNITIWGRIRGFYSYISVAGYNITIPKITAEIWQ